MKMNYKFKKALAIFLTLIMVMNIFPISVYAENDNAGREQERVSVA